MVDIEYSETTGWEEWMNEYKYGAFYIYPPTGVIERVDDLRERYDPKSSAICQAHISVSDPLTGPITDEQIEELIYALSRIPDFEITYGPLRSFPPYPGVTYTITPEDKFMELRQAIHQTSIFKDSPLTRKDRHPHMTIAEFITVEETDRLLQDLQSKVPEGTFVCNEIELAVPDKSFYFQRTLKLPLGLYT